jgi:hypothetical protein
VVVGAAHGQNGRGKAVKSLIVVGALGLILAGCGPRVPDSGAGVGFGDYQQYGATGGFPVAQPGLPPPSAVSAGAIPSSDLAAAGIGGAPLGSVPTVGGFQVPQDPTRSGGGIEASPGNAAPVLVGVGGAPGSSRISDEQDFDAVASRESIESDAARRAQQAAQYQVIQPTALSNAPHDTGPNIVQYALNAPNRRGQEWYSRSIFSGQGRFERNCTSYRSPDEAQRDFLARGGPERDPRGIDPDGDGFACGWDPAPFRAAVGLN